MLDGVTMSQPDRIALDASIEADRQGATPVTLKALGRVFAFWRVTNAEAARLMGVSERTWNRMKAASWSGALSQDQMLRASALIGLYKALHLYFSDPLADDWVGLANSGAQFNQRRPLDVMISEGVPGILATRDYVDALRGGA